MSANGTSRHFATPQNLVASLIGHLGSSAFRLSTTAVSMSLTGTRFSSESAPRPFHDGIRGRGGTILSATLPFIDGRFSRTCELTPSIVPRGTPFHRSVELELSPMGLIDHGCHAAAAISRVKRKSLP